MVFTLFEKHRLIISRKKIKLVLKLNDMIKSLPTLTLPLDNDYLVIQIDGCETGWGGALFRKTTKYDPKIAKSLCRYALGKYREKGHLISIHFTSTQGYYTKSIYFISTQGKRNLLYLHSGLL